VFVTGAPVIQAVRLWIDGKPATGVATATSVARSKPDGNAEPKSPAAGERAAEPGPDKGDVVQTEISLPGQAVVGKPLRTKVFKPADAQRLKGKTFALESGPEGLTVSPAGELAWTPKADQIGRHDVTVRIADKKSESLASATVEVFSAADAAAVNGDMFKLAGLHRLKLAGEHFQLVPGVDDASMLLLEGQQLRRLGADGLTVRETIKLPKAYEHIRERPDYFVALAGGDEKCLDLIDKKTLKVRRSIQMEYRARFDLALNPVRRECYVTVEKAAGDGLRSDILVVNEATGDVREPEDFIGRWVRVSNNGNVLFAGYKEIYERAAAC
jgi:hypothetical protein